LYTVYFMLITSIQCLVRACGSLGIKWCSIALNLPYFPRHLKGLKLRSFRMCHEQAATLHVVVQTGRRQTSDWVQLPSGRVRWTTWCFQSQPLRPDQVLLPARQDYSSTPVSNGVVNGSVPITCWKANLEVGHHLEVCHHGYPSLSTPVVSLSTAYPAPAACCPAGAHCTPIGRRMRCS